MVENTVENQNTQPVEEVKTNKKMPKALKISLITIGSIFGTFGALIGTINLCKFSAYEAYYRAETTLCKIPGLKDNFVPQDIVQVDGTDTYILGGYMSDKTASRLYITDTNNNSYYSTLKYSDGTDYIGHCGGVTIANNRVYLGDSDVDPTHVYSVSLSDVLDQNKVEVTMDDGVIVNNYASSLYSDGNYIYVGEYNYTEKGFACKHEVQTNTEGTHHAIVTKYAANDLTTPLAVYSIRDKVQGFAILDDGRFIMSTSYGLASSEYFVYNPECCYLTSDTIDGAPLYIIENPSKVIKGPAMAEGLDVIDGKKVVTVTETASNKYIFGKFFNAINVNVLEF